MVPNTPKQHALSLFIISSKGEIPLRAYEGFVEEDNNHLVVTIKLVNGF